MNNDPSILLLIVFADLLQGERSRRHLRHHTALAADEPCRWDQKAFALTF